MASCKFAVQCTMHKNDLKQKNQNGIVTLCKNAQHDIFLLLKFSKLQKWRSFEERNGFSVMNNC